MPAPVAGITYLLESQVLLGCRRLLTERRVVCGVLEFGQTTFDMGNRPEELASYMGSCGYWLRNLMPGDPAFPGGAIAETAEFAMSVFEPDPGG